MFTQVLFLSFIFTFPFNSFIKCLTLYDKPLCSSCKWFISSNKGLLREDDYGLCKLYKNNYDINGNKMIIYEYAKHCRTNEDMCGSEGHLYDDKYDHKYEHNINFLQQEEYEEYLEKILDEYDELNNRGWGEVNESIELEEIEDDFIRLFQKVKDFMVRKN
jgi:hypothetical protein